VDGGTSLRARYHAHPGTRDYSTDEQLDGECFRLSGRPFGASGPAAPSPLTGVPVDHLDSDAEVDMVVREASSQHPETAAESIRTGGSQSLSQTGPTTIQALVYGQGRARSKTTSSVPQSPSSFVKLARDKLLRMESDPSPAITRMASATTPGSHHDITNFTPSSTLTASRQSLHHSSTSQSFLDSTPEELTIKQEPSTPERTKSAPVRRDGLPEQGTRPNAGRSQSDTAVRSSPTKAGPDKLSEVRKRIDEFEAKMRGGAK
jgi:hypothetical protein